MGRLRRVYYGTDGGNPVEFYCDALARARTGGAQESITYWSRRLTLARARRRAAAGDALAARRLQWITDTRKRNDHGWWLVDRFRMHDRQVTKIIRSGGSPDCAACGAQLRAAQRLRDEYAARIIALPQTEPPRYAEYWRREMAASIEADAWLRRQLDQLQPPEASA